MHTLTCDDSYKQKIYPFSIFFLLKNRLTTVHLKLELPYVRAYN